MEQQSIAMTRPFVFGANFKMNQTPVESAAFYTRLAESVTIPDGVNLFIIPPFTSLAAVQAAANGGPNSLWIGAQNVHWADEGAFTGEISVAMLVALDVDLVLLGHAERRRQFHETDANLNMKVHAVLGAGLRVLLAVGETAEERGYGVSEETVARQLKIDLHDAAEVEDAAALLQIAYEPVWSVGADGTPARPGDVGPMAKVIRTTLGDVLGDSGRDVPILYGGSVDPSNAGSFTALRDIDGLLVGRAGWTVAGFLATYESSLAGRGDGSNAAEG